jgi:hypothetical protein
MTVEHVLNVDVEMPPNVHATATGRARRITAAMFVYWASQFLSAAFWKNFSR